MHVVHLNTDWCVWTTLQLYRMPWPAPNRRFEVRWSAEGADAGEVFAEDEPVHVVGALVRAHNSCKTKRAGARERFPRYSAPNLQELWPPVPWSAWNR